MNAKTEQRELEQFIAKEAPRESDLRGRLADARRSAIEIESLTTLSSVDPGLNFSKKSQAAIRRGREERKQKVAALEAEQKKLGAELGKLTPRIEAARKRLGELEAAENARACKRCTELVAAAIAGAKSGPKFRAEAAKRADLQAKASSEQRQFDQLLATPVKPADDIQARAEKLLSTGEMDAAPTAVDPARVKELQIRIKTLTAALQIQEKAAQKAHQEFVAEVATILEPAMEDIAGRIVSGMEIVRQAIKEGRLIQSEAGMGVGALGALPNFIYTGQVDGQGFEFWLIDMRRRGFNI